MVAPAPIPDKVWGEVTLEHGVLEELAASTPVQRLHGIAMSGASRYIAPHMALSTRFEHSVGVMYILRTLGASLEEQVAGLLHDIPHTAFSHTVDIVFPSSEHNYHEQFQREIVMASDIPAILARHGIELRAAIEPEHFPLLEQPLPGLCADRIDYSLRDLHAAGKVTTAEAKDFLEQLRATSQGIMIKSIDAALYFSMLFLEANDSFWTGPRQAGAYWALAGAIKRAFKVGGFSRRDLFTTDEVAMSRLRALDDPVVTSYLALLDPQTEFTEVRGTGPCFTTVMKQRTVDPFVLSESDQIPRRLSDYSTDYARLLKDRARANSTTYRLWSPSIGPDLLESIEH